MKKPVALEKFRPISVFRPRKLAEGMEIPRKFRPVNVLASAMTTMNGYMGVASIFASIAQDYRWAATCILLAILFDMLDGFVARLTRTVSEFGKQLDSLCDAISFGVAPAVLIFMVYLPEGLKLQLPARAEDLLDKTGAYIGIIYVICTLLRLARFNTFQADLRDSFIGLPSPAAGGTLAACILFLHHFESLNRPLDSLAYFLLGLFTVLLALLMVSSIRYPKGRLKTLVLKPQHAYVTLAGVAFIIAVIHYALTRSASLVLFPLALLYVVFGPAEAVYASVTGRKLLSGGRKHRGGNSGNADADPSPVPPSEASDVNMHDSPEEK
ncbi:MAG TPA: CDP-diacylglycerol--serine O-phosphatidyltransferase [Candidatus Hydrogenedentes bacterium]|nr:CDP-diacylglycerol--serine O-phosphatidyltransferase [Candidatus Hydrogenedentota bacterium]